MFSPFPGARSSGILSAFGVANREIEYLPGYWVVALNEEKEILKKYFLRKLGEKMAILTQNIAFRKT
jgi:hypothetical protein